jgi:transposase
MKDHITIGMDLGDLENHIVVMDAEGTEIEVTSIANTKERVREYFSRFPGAVVAMEAGTHSSWISREIKEAGCDVLVGNPRKLRLIWDSTDKDDENDARLLCMICRLEPRLLWPIRHREPESQCDLQIVKSRQILVGTRTKLINHVRGAVKAMGERLPGCSADAFARRVVKDIPDELRVALDGVLKVIETLTEQIRRHDRLIAHLCRERYPETGLLSQVNGVGPVTSLAYVLTIEDPERFPKSRYVGSYLGLTPKRDQSGQTDKQLRITKAGDTYLRTLLVNCSNYILGPFGPDSDLRRHGLKIAARGGKNARRRAKVAVARKLAVLLHRLWMNKEPYERLYKNINKQNHKNKAAVPGAMNLSKPEAAVAMAAG